MRLGSASSSTRNFKYSPIEMTTVGDESKSQGRTVVTSALSDAASEQSSNTERKAHIFEDPKVAEYWRGVYDKAQYEGRDYFDPELEWTAAEEKSLLWKTEWHVTLWAFIMFVALDIDRFNITNAVAGDMLPDLGLTTTDYNLGNTLNLVCFLSAELPSQLISKKVGPDRWIPTQLVLWSVVAITQCSLKGRSGFLVTRALVGLLEGGFIPDICLWMSYFYTSKEFPFRLSLFYIANPLTQAISALIAYGIFHLDGHNGWEGWRWLFLIEGIATVLIGIASFFMMPPSAVQTKTWFRPHGWYTEREEKIMINRILRDDPSKGDMHNREALSVKLLFKSVMDYDLWPIYIIRLIGDINTAPVKYYMSILLRNMGFSTLNTNLLMIPNNMLYLVLMVSVGYISEKVNQRALVILAQPLWILPVLAVMRWWGGFMVNNWGSYIVLLFALGYPPLLVIAITWCSANSNSVRTRTVSAAIVNMFSQSAGIISSQIYRADDAPLYKRGNTQLFAIAWASAASILLTKLYYMWRNKQRDKIWNAMSVDEQIDYINNTTDEGNKRLDFRFVH